MALVELSVVEQRYHAVMEVLAGMSVTEVAGRYGVHRNSVHEWMRHYERGGLAALTDRSHDERYSRALRANGREEKPVLEDACLEEFVESHTRRRREIFVGQT